MVLIMTIPVLMLLLLIRLALVLLLVHVVLLLLLLVILMKIMPTKLLPRWQLRTRRTYLKSTSEIFRSLSSPSADSCGNFEKSRDELRRCSRDTQPEFVFVFVRVSSVSPALPLLELSSQPVALK